MGEKLHYTVFCAAAVVFVLQAVGYFAPAWFVMETRSYIGPNGFHVDGRYFEPPLMQSLLNSPTNRTRREADTGAAVGDSIGPEVPRLPPQTGETGSTLEKEPENIPEDTPNGEPLPPRKMDETETDQRPPTGDKEPNPEGETEPAENPANTDDEAQVLEKGREPPRSETDTVSDKEDGDAGAGAGMDSPSDPPRNSDGGPARTPPASETDTGGDDGNPAPNFRGDGDDGNSDDGMDSPSDPPRNSDGGPARKPPASETDTAGDDGNPAPNFRGDGDDGNSDDGMDSPSDPPRNSDGGPVRKSPASETDTGGDDGKPTLISSGDGGNGDEADSPPDDVDPLPKPESPTGHDGMSDPGDSMTGDTKPVHDNTGGSTWGGSGNDPRDVTLVNNDDMADGGDSSPKTGVDPAGNAPSDSGQDSRRTMENDAGNPIMVYITAGLWYGRVCIHSLQPADGVDRAGSGREWCTMYSRTNDSTLDNVSSLAEYRVETTVALVFSFVGLLAASMSCCTRRHLVSRLVIVFLSMIVSCSLMAIPVVRTLVRHGKEHTSGHHQVDSDTQPMITNVQHDAFDHWSAIVCAVGSIVGVVSTLVLGICAYSERREDNGKYKLKQVDAMEGRDKSHLPNNWMVQSRAFEPVIVVRDDSLKAEQDCYTVISDQDISSHSHTAAQAGSVRDGGELENSFEHDVNLTDETNSKEVVRFNSLHAGKTNSYK